MRKLLKPKWIIPALVIILAAGLLINRNKQQKQAALANEVTTSVETGTVRQIVSVSGIAKAKQIADLAFPVGGVIDKVLVDVGDKVRHGDILATLDLDTLQAEKQAAAASLREAKSQRDKLLNGLTNYSRTTALENLKTAEEQLETTRELAKEKIKNAYRTLLSTDLKAFTNDLGEDATAPEISGTYTCGREGTYYIDVFNSKAQSGFSFNLSGLENGTYEASVDQPGPLGECGLKIKFTAGDYYNGTHWQVDIPNRRSSYFVTNYNNYVLTKTNAETSLKLAEQKVSLTKAETEEKLAPARKEDIAAAEAKIAAAAAQVDRLNSVIADRFLRAPFAGVVTKADILPGETVGTSPIITLMGEDSSFEIRAKIPEIDIGKVMVGQKAEMIFDAKTDEIVTGSISFISPQSIEIDGVSYYEATIKFDRTPVWIRGGLNADVDIIITQKDNVLRIPKRFLSKTGDGYFVLLKHGDNQTATTSIEVVMEGNDGFVAVKGLNQGDILVAP